MPSATSKRAALFAVSEGGPLSLLYAATYPDRVDAIVLYETFVRWGGPPDEPSGTEGDVHTKWTEWFIANAFELWGTGVSLQFMSTSQADDERLKELCARAERLSCSPGNMRALFEMLRDFNVSAAMRSVQAPCLVMRGGAGSTFVAHSNYLIRHLPDAHLAVLEGAAHYPWFLKGDRIVAEVEEFLTGARSPIATNRQLATVLSLNCGLYGAGCGTGGPALARRAAEAPPAGAMAARALPGPRIDFAGDGVFATFDGPARALSCACAIRDGVRSLGSRSEPAYICGRSSAAVTPWRVSQSTSVPA